MRINDHHEIDLNAETKLAALARAEQALAATQGSLPPLPTRLELQNPAADLPALWRAPTTSHKDRRRLCAP